MVTKTITQLVDDMDGTSIAERSVRIAIDGSEYEIDLSAKNEKLLQKALAPYLSKARRIPKSRRKPRRQVDTPPSSQAVRAWAEARGITVPARGRIPNAVVEQYVAAGN